MHALIAAVERSRKTDEQIETRTDEHTYKYMYMQKYTHRHTERRPKTRRHRHAETDMQTVNTSIRIGRYGEKYRQNDITDRKTNRNCNVT